MTDSKAVASVDNDKFNRQAVAEIVATRRADVAAFVPTSFDGVMEMAKLMATSGAAVPKHLRQAPGKCLSVAMTAYQNGFNPFLLAADTYEVNDVLSYGAKSISAMIDNSPLLAEPLQVRFEGEWPKRVAVVIGRFRGVNEPRVVEAEAETITTRNSPLWKQQPDQQLLYYGKRMWARAWMPGVLLGVLSDDEAVAADRATDVTVPSAIEAVARLTAPVTDGPELGKEPAPEPESKPTIPMLPPGFWERPSLAVKTNTGLASAIEAAPTQDLLRRLNNDNPKLLLDHPELKARLDERDAEMAPVGHDEHGEVVE